MASEDKNIRESLAQLRFFESSAQTLQSRLEIVNAAMNEYAMASSTLEGIKTQKPEEETLIPVGGGSFARAKLGDVTKIVVGVGAGIAIEKPIDDSITEVKSRLADLEKARTSLQEQLTQTVMRIEAEREKVNEIVRKRGGDSLTVL